MTKGLTTGVGFGFGIVRGPGNGHDSRHADTSHGTRDCTAGNSKPVTVAAVPATVPVPVSGNAPDPEPEPGCSILEPYAEKEFPHPQALFAFGFRNLNPAPCNPVT